MPVKKIVKTTVKRSYTKKQKALPSNFISRAYKNITGKSLGGFKITRFLDGTPCIRNSAANTVEAVQGAGVTTFLTVNNASNETIDGGRNVPFTLQFSLDQVAGYTDIVNICDKYMIYGVKIRARYSANDILATSTSVNMVPAIRWIQDEDDAQILSPSLLRQKMGLRTKRLDKSDCFIFVKPKTAGVVYKDDAGQAYTPNKTRYVDSNNATVPHYGIKGYIENMSLPDPGSARQQINFEVKFYIRAKNLQ